MPSRVLICCLVLVGVGCVAPPRSYFVADSRPAERVDYSRWDALLRTHVVDGSVDYAGFAASADFTDFRRTLRKVRFTRATTADQRLAFWMNAYNASAIASILAGESPATLLGRSRFFLREYHAIGGEEITLWDLEHERIRPVGDPRIHFAIVCASASCPRLASEAFFPERLDGQLEQLTRAFINDPEKNRYDLAEGVAYLSQIFEWYEEDFAGTAGGVGAWISRYVDDAEVARALAEGRLEVEYLPYDRSLNGVLAR